MIIVLLLLFSVRSAGCVVVVVVLLLLPVVLYCTQHPVIFVCVIIFFEFELQDLQHVGLQAQDFQTKQKRC